MSRRRLSRKETLDADGLADLFEPYVWAWFNRKFVRPSPPQLAAWPKIADGKNTLIFSPTGSGKTLAAFLSCINELYRRGDCGELADNVYVLYISPLKALNNDIQKNLVSPLRGIKMAAQKAGVDVPTVRSAVRTGDTPVRKRMEMARRPPHILITTPESLYIILATEKFREALRSVEYVIVDEIHALSDNKRGVHLSLSLERLQHLVGKEFVRIGLSATQRPLDKIAGFLVGMRDDGGQRDCEIADVSGRKDLNLGVISPVDNLLEAQLDAIWGSAFDKMTSLIRDHNTTLIFTNSRYKTERTALRLNELSAADPVRVGAHHGSMSREVRLGMENELKRGNLDALVATSSLELGIDVGSIDLVCQIESPKSVSRGMQRIGRAGHLLDATSKGRLLVADRDDLVECAVLVKAIVDGQIDTTRIPSDCLDVLAQQVVGAVAADDWNADDLFHLCRRAYCYKDLAREDYDRVLEMTSGGDGFDNVWGKMEQPPFAKIFWDKVNGLLTSERGSRMIAFRSGGTIPDVADYDVYLTDKSTKVGQLDEGFVEELRPGDVFILGSSSWRVLGIERNRVNVEDVYGRPPTIPYWKGDRSSRTSDLGLMVGRFRREMEEQISKGDAVRWLEEEYYVDSNGARAIHEYFREQKLVTGMIPSDRLVLVEHFKDELGQLQIVIHSSFGICVNDTWAMALSQAIEDKYKFRPQTATIDDGILITLPADTKRPQAPDPGHLLDLITSDNLDALIKRVVTDSPLFKSRFRHNAVRALLVLRESRGRRTPVWLQSLRAQILYEACGDDPTFPAVAETMRECLTDALDVANLKKVLRGLESGRIARKTVKTRIPSPFSHSLLLLGQYGEVGSIPPRERRSRLVHLHRELLKQILDEETLQNLLSQEAVLDVESRLQHTHPQRRARSANELARALLELGDLVDTPDEEMSLIDRTDGDPKEYLDELRSRGRAMPVPIPTVETNRVRWISTENFPLYRAAFALNVNLDDHDKSLIAFLSGKDPRPVHEIPGAEDVGERLDRLVLGYGVLRLRRDGESEYVAAKAWIPEGIYEKELPRDEARAAIIQRFLRRRGPVTKYEVMERYGFPDEFVEETLAKLLEAGTVAKGEYVPDKALPQWCHRRNLEEIHRLTLNRLRKEMEPAMPEEYADFLIRWQHVHPTTQLSGVAGLRKVIGQIQGLESFQAIVERDVLPARVADYDPSMLDRLCYGGEVVWRRFDHKSMKRGQIGFCFRRDRDWLVVDPRAGEMNPEQWDDDIHDACSAVREFLRYYDACFFDDIVAATGLDWRLVLRAVWHLVWTGEVTNDSYESIRHANIASGLSACYDLGTRPGREGATIDSITKHMLEYRSLDPRLGRWEPTERLVPSSTERPDDDDVMHQWAHLLLRRYGIVSRDVLKREAAAPQWKEVRRALAKLELLGKVRRGFFVQELSGEQYAYPEAVDALRDAKLKHPDPEAGSPARPDEPMILLNSCDPANPFSALFPVTDEVGDAHRFVRSPAHFTVVQAGRPILLYHHPHNAKLLVDLPKEDAEHALRALMQIIDKPAKAETYEEIGLRDWNGHPVDVSPVRHLLTKLGFVKGKPSWKGFVYDGTYRPTEETQAAFDKQIPDVFERVGKEKAPVRYDAEWIVSRSSEQLRPKVRQLIGLLEGILPKECAFVFGPRQFRVNYRGVRCITPYILQKKIWVQIAQKGWTRGIPVEADTDLKAPDFAERVLARFDRVRQEIDSQLGRKAR